MAASKIELAKHIKNVVFRDKRLQIHIRCAASAPDGRSGKANVNVCVCGDHPRMVDIGSGVFYCDVGHAWIAENMSKELEEAEIRIATAVLQGDT